MDAESKKTISAIFNDSSNLVDAIDLKRLFPISIDAAKENSTLNSFFWLDEDKPYSEIIKRGFLSLRKGFYKIASAPYYRTDITPAIFAADVHYLGFNKETNDFIRYHANVGPITNTSNQYMIWNRDYSQRKSIPILGAFDENITRLNPKNDREAAKQIFFDRIYIENRVFYVHDSIWDPAYPIINMRKLVKWSFLDF